MMDRRLLLYNILPVVAIHVLFLPLWFLRHPFFTYNVSLGEMLINILLVPLYLVVLNYRHTLKQREYTFWPYIILMWLVTLGSNGLTFFNWVISSGRLAEQGTFSVFQWIVAINFLSILILGLMVQGALSYRKRSLV